MCPLLDDSTQTPQLRFLADRSYYKTAGTMLKSRCHRYFLRDVVCVVSVVSAAMATRQRPATKRFAASTRADGCQRVEIEGSVFCWCDESKRSDPDKCVDIKTFIILWCVGSRRYFPQVVRWTHWLDSRQRPWASVSVSVLLAEFLPVYYNSLCLLR